jgi:mRNA interferase HigB
MHIVTRKRLIEFGQEHQDADGELREWERIVRKKKYTNSVQVKHDFPSVDFVGPHRAVFNICHNDYRLVVDMRFDLSRAFIRHVVTHQEYDRLIKRKLL